MISEKNKTFTVIGENYLEKRVCAATKSGCRVWVPAHWVDRQVAVILLPKSDEEK